MRQIHTFMLLAIMGLLCAQPPALQTFTMSPAIPILSENFSCHVSFTHPVNTTFTIYAGLAVDGTINESYNTTNSTYANATTWTYVSNLTGRVLGENLSCWAFATDGINASSVFFTSNVTIGTSTDRVNRWYPDEIYVSAPRLNVTYPKMNYTHQCFADIWVANDSEITAVTFEIKGAGVNIDSTQSESIGSQSTTDALAWHSGNFTTNATGIMNCSVTAIDEYGNSASAFTNFYVTNALNTCGESDVCSVTSTINLSNGIFHYYWINVTSTGNLVSTSGAGGTFYVDTNFTLAGTLSSNGSTGGGSAGTIYIYANEVFNQTGAITGYGATGAASGGSGGNGMMLYVYADQWIQSGSIAVRSGTGGACAAGGGSGGAGGGNAGIVQFTGREWLSTGTWNYQCTGGSAGCTGGGAASGGEGGWAYGGDGFVCNGFLNKTAGAVTFAQTGTGAGGSATNVGNDGGDGGDFFGPCNFLTVNGRAWASGFTATGTFSNGGVGGGCTGAGCAGGWGGDLGISSGAYNLITADGTDFYWNISTSIAFTGGTGGNGGVGAGSTGRGGRGGGWYSTDNTTYSGIKCRGNCSIITQIQLLGGAGGTGSIAGAAGVNASWEVQYNDVGKYNNFTKLLPARTTYNLSTNAAFIRNATLQDTIGLSSELASAYALEYVDLNWSSNNLENRTLYWEILEINPITGTRRYLFQNASAMPSPVRTVTVNNLTLDTNRFDNTTYTYYARERSDYYRYTAWTSATLQILKAFSNVTGTSPGMSALGVTTFSCNFTGYDYIRNFTKYDPNVSRIRPVYYGNVRVILQDNVTNYTYNATWDATQELYTVSTSDNFMQGNHSWWCTASKANYHNSTYAGSPFYVPSFIVRLPTGVSQIQFICIFPTVSNMRPIGQTSTSPIMTIVNNNITSHNYTLRLSQQPSGGSIYFSPNNTRTYQFLLNATHNITACEMTPYHNTTACRLWLFADCVNATIVSGLNVSYIVGETQ